MSQTKPWIDRIPLILEHLEKCPQPFYGRAEVARLFFCGRSAAYKLMRVAGASRDENQDIAVSRDNLRWYVLQLPESRKCVAQWEHTKRLERQLVQTAEEMRLKRVKIPMKPAEEWPRWKDIPNVTVTRGRMEISFDGQDDLLRTLMMVAGAMADEEEFARLCGDPKPDPSTMEIRRRPAVTDFEFSDFLRLATPEEKARILEEERPTPASPGQQPRPGG